MSSIAKVSHLISIASRNPREFLDRVGIIVDARTRNWWPKAENQETATFGEVVRTLGKRFGVDPDLPEYTEPLREIEETVRQNILNLPPNAPFPMAFNADFSMARLCHLMCRFLKPEVIVETGVAYGVTTAFLLKALEANGSGRLHSIDLPPLGRTSKSFIGTLVPEKLKSQWSLHTGVSHRILPHLIRDLGGIEMFLLDDCMTYRNVRRELDIVTPHLRSPAAVIVDNANENCAFSEWVKAQQPAYWETLREPQKGVLMGVSML